jgi:membrane protease YdiL (CAAX protease family)
MAQKKVKSEEIEEETDELKESPTDALVEHVNEEGFDLKTFIGDYIGFAIIGYLLTLLFYSLLFPLLWSFILWIFTGFIIYKSLESYGDDKTWFTQILDDFGNYGFTGQSKDLETKTEGEVELEIKKEKEDSLSLINYTEKFDEWRIAKNAVQGPFISAGDKISRFSFNSKSLYKLRLWLFIIIFPVVIWWLGLLSIVQLPIYAWYNVLGFTTFQSEHLASISTLSLSFFVVIRIYSHCTNNRNLPFNSNIFSDYDDYVTKHLFKLPKINSLPITLKALLLDFLIGWLILILIMGLTTFENTVCSPAEVYSFDSLEFMTLLILMLSVAVFTPIIEELVFRGFVLDVASEAYGKWGAIFISALLFSIIHIEPVAVINAFFGGIIYGYVRIRTDSLWPTIFLHSIWNAHLYVISIFCI